MIEFLSRALAKGGKRLNDLKFGTFVGRFLSDLLASTAAKGLINEGLNEVAWVLHNEEFWWKASYEQFDGVVVDTIKRRVLVESK